MPLGAVAALEALPDQMEVERLLRIVTRLPRPKRERWKWPAPRLTYDNARIPEALLAAEAGISGFSFTPVGGVG